MMNLQTLLGIDLPIVQFGIDPNAVAAGPPRLPFSREAADVLEEFRPPVVSFHFGLPSEDLVARVRGWGAKILSSATSVEEACWLEESMPSSRKESRPEAIAACSCQTT